ncbi:hypothetical protein E4T56_gene9874 [Termitomyces sp. T112]|nr:hypothetical protein E4T56_gene9874 [Termitomyces sp. T112]KAH0584567.1 hypothetical protein H2248_010100 [Termitomyces sp. 'cryptogamus']
MGDPSPFIPPLPGFYASPRQPAQPVIPENPAEPAANLGWGGQAQHPGAFPILPSSPYTPGFQPHLGATPNNNTGRLPPTVTQEFVGYPGAPPAIHLAPPTPYPAPGQPWPGMPRQQGQPFLQPPNTGGPFPGYGNPYPPHHGAWPQQPPNPYGAYYGGPGWGMPMNTLAALATPGVAPTPGYGAFLNFDPAWNFPPGTIPARGVQTGQLPQNELPERVHVGRSSARVGDRVDQFMAGTGYGPVLDPFEAKILGVHPKVNPLLEPLADTAPDRPHLKWNMLFRSNDCTLSTDESHVSWSKGRDEPATFPRVTKMTIVSETFPWSVPIEATNPAIGVTCGEIIDQLSVHFYRLTSKQDFEVLDQKRQADIAQVYRHNRSREPGVPGGTLKEGIRRLDYLGKDIIFGGIYCNDQLVFRLMGTIPPCHYVLKCLKQYALTAQEAKEHEERRRELEEKEREENKRARRQATVEDDRDSE